jgi:hypothetical protein
MISCQAIGTNGRFGNQMFQYATLYALGKELHYEIGVPYNQRNQNDKLDFCLPDVFDLSASNSSQNFMSSMYIEPHFNYDANIHNIPDNCNIRGYFQTEKYFKKYKKDLINKEFKFKQSIETQANELFAGKNSELVSLHMRLGDYLNVPECHPICSIEYYKEALKLIPSDVQIILFSDDYGVANNIIKDLGRHVMMYGSNDKFLDMCLMTKCEYHIIANSSFSWWGSWLSNSKKTIAPKQWFGSSPNMPKNWDSIYADSWDVI